MSTTTEVNVHFEGLLQAIHDAHRDVLNYLRDSENWTDAAKVEQKAKITTIRSGLLHAADCSICTGWVE
tara:strand:- start:77 stop:283 length:207 start_codon:yes stop_codon:yes gene_type:complete